MKSECNNMHGERIKACPTVSQVLGDLRREVLVAAVGTTRTLLFEPRHRQESVSPKDVVIEGCLI